MLPDICKKLVSVLSITALLFNQLLFAPLVFAEEATPSAQPVSAEASPSPSPVLTSEPIATASAVPEATTSATLSPAPTPVPTLISSGWKDNGDGSMQTVDDVTLAKEYSAPQNDKVKITFIKFPAPSGKIAVKEVKLTPEQIKLTGALSDTAYDVSSTMQNNTFEYTLTLPTTKTDNVEVKASEDGQNFVTVGGVSAQTDTLTITGLDHFTIFVVVGTINASTATAFSETSDAVVINEFLFNPSTGNDWIELYNKGASRDLNNWVLDDDDPGTSTVMATLNQTIPAGGFLAVDVSNRLDLTGDVLILKDNSGTAISEVAYKDGTLINGAQDIGTVSANESVARSANGGSIWVRASSPTKGYTNENSTVYVDDNFTQGSEFGTQGFPFGTIQKGVDSVSASGTVNVAAGTYSETVVINKALTLNGAQAGVDPRKGRSGGESIIDGTGRQTAVHLTGNDVTLNGFTIAYTGVGDWTNGTYGILNGTSSGGVIKNNIIDGRFYFGVITQGIIQHYHFSYNVVKPAGTSVYIDGANDLTFDHNLFQGGVLLTGGNTYGTVQNVVFDSNETTAQTNDDIYAFGFAVWDAVQNVEFVHNDIHGNRRGIQVAHSQIGWPHPKDLTIHSNNIYDNSLPGVNTPYGIENVRVDENTGQLFHDDPGITSVTATNNWWGSAVLTTIQSKVNDINKVTVTPYYVNSAKTILSSTTPATVYVGSNYTDNNADGHVFGYDAFANIQEGINAVAANGTVQVMAGTYTEQIIVSKSVTVSGVNSATSIIQSPASLSTETDGDGKSIVEITGSSVVATFKNFTVRGDLAGITSAIHVHEGANATIQDNIILGTGSLSGTLTGQGIVVGDSLDGNTDVAASGVNVISNNQLSGFHRAGIAVIGVGNNATINNNTVTGAGATSLTSQQGITIQDGATGSISGNTISNITYTGAAPTTAAAIFLWDSANDINVSANIIQDSQTGIMVQAATGIKASTNSISVSPTAAGLMNSGNLPAGFWLLGRGGASTSCSGGDGITGGLGCNSGITLSGNSITGGGSGFGVKIAGTPELLSSWGTSPAPTSATLGSNTISGWLHAVWVGVSSLANTVVANMNQIKNNADFAVNNTDSLTTVDAKNNDWGIYTDSAVASKNSGNVIYTPYVGSSQTILTPNITLTSAAPQVVVGSTGTDSTVNVPSSVNNSTLDVTNLVVIAGGTKTATLPNNITVSAATAVGNVTVQLPAGIQIQGSAGNWTGIINNPTVQSNSSVSVTPPSGYSTATSSVIEVGYGDVPLTFNKAVRILIAGQSGKLAAYSRSGITTQITAVCSADDQSAMDTALAAGGDCKLDIGSDLVIWTKHFTKFVTYTQTAISFSSSGSGSGDSGGGSASAPVCNDTKPGSAPTLLSAVAGANSVTLIWSEAKDPVTYYLVAYGTSSGSLQFGNPNVGGKGTTSYIVSGLSGGRTYYFKVRAGNGCAPGDYSNEIAATVGGAELGGPAAGFEAGVLGKSTDQQQDKEEKEQKGTVEGVEATPTESLQEVGFLTQRNWPWIAVAILIILGIGYYLFIRRR